MRASASAQALRRRVRSTHLFIGGKQHETENMEVSLAWPAPRRKTTWKYERSRVRLLIC